MCLADLSRGTLPIVFVFFFCLLFGFVSFVILVTISFLLRFLKSVSYLYVYKVFWRVWAGVLLPGKAPKTIITCHLLCFPPESCVEYKTNNPIN